MNAEFTITSEYSNARIDVIMAELLEDYSRSQIQKMFPEGEIIINGLPCTSKKYIAKEGDIVQVIIDDKDNNSLPLAENIPIDIVYEDENYLVVNKPKGMVVHPANGNETGTLVNALIYYLGDSFTEEMKDVTSPDRPGIVHRIDKDTTGLLVVAKTEESFRDLSIKFKDHEITRMYLALVYNNLSDDEGRIDIPIGRDPKNRLRRAANGLESRSAVTNYRVVERMGNFNLIEATLETGRTHQIRVHMSYIGHPVAGDPVYGPRKDILGAGGQMLHAGKLGFATLDNKYIEFTMDPPDKFQSILAKARKFRV